MLSFTTYQINVFFRVLNRTGCFLTEEEHEVVAKAAQFFAEGYASLAASQASGGIPAFKIRPKFHMWCEVARKIQVSRFNVMGSSCWADEDFIGRCSRTARSCSSGITGLSMSVRAIQKILEQYKIQFGRL